MWSRRDDDESPLDKLLDVPLPEDDGELFAWFPRPEPSQLLLFSASGVPLLYFHRGLSVRPVLQFMNNPPPPPPPADDDAAASVFSPITLYEATPAPDETTIRDAPGPWIEIMRVLVYGETPYSCSAGTDSEEIGRNQRD